MIERFAAGGTPDLWISGSEAALRKSGFSKIKVTKGLITAQRDGPIAIQIIPGKNGKTTIAINSSSNEDIALYKSGVAKQIQILQKKKEGKPLPKRRILEPEKKPPEKTKPTPKSEEITTKTPQQKNVAFEQKKKWYQSEWLTLLILFLIPPLGIGMMWSNKIYSQKLRPYITVFFGFYTILWFWVLLLPFVMRERNASEATQEQESVSVVQDNPEVTPTDSGENLQAYWEQPDVVNYNAQMPALISQYDNLYINQTLLTPDGRDQAENIFAQVEGLANAVLAVAEEPETSTAYSTQQKINQSANLFLTAISESRQALDSGDITEIDNSYISWTNAENAFYEIQFTYQQQISSPDDPGNQVVPTETIENPSIEDGTIIIENNEPYDAIVEDNTNVEGEENG